MTAWRSHILGPNGDHTLMQWSAPAALTNASGPYADCLRLAGGQGCDLQRGTMVGSPACYWGTHQVPLSDCDFQETLDSIRSRVRVQAAWGFAAAFDADEEAYTAADQCLIVASAVDCKSLPMFMPGYDVKEAAQHDAQAILTGGKPAKLTWTPGTGRAAGGWYNAEPICQNRPSGIQCDEYSFRSTIEGGPGASLRKISAADSMR